MAGSKDRADQRSRRAWALAQRQHGLLTRADLLSLGFSREAIDHRLARGRLHRVASGVYSVGRPGAGRDQRWMAAVLGCGATAALSHRSAAALWGIGAEGAQIEVSIRRPHKRRRAGVLARRRASMPNGDITSHRRIPVTDPARTLLDLAAIVGPSRLERSVNEADKLDLIDPEGLRARLDAFRGEPGVVTLRHLLDRESFLPSDSDLEVRFRRIAESAGLPAPMTRASLNGFEVDFYWPQLGLVVETDGLRYHRTPSSQARDRLRDQTHTAAGLTALRFTYRQVRHEPAWVREVLRATVGLRP